MTKIFRQGGHIAHQMLGPEGFPQLCYLLEVEVCGADGETLCWNTLIYPDRETAEHNAAYYRTGDAATTEHRNYRAVRVSCLARTALDPQS